MNEQEMEALHKHVEQLKLNRADGHQAPFIPMGAIARSMPVPDGVSVPNNNCSIWRRDFGFYLFVTCFVVFLIKMCKYLEIYIKI